MTQYIQQLSNSFIDTYYDLTVWERIHDVEKLIAIILWAT